MTDRPPLEDHLRSQRSKGRKLLVPYLTGGYPPSTWPRLIEGFGQAGADAIEVGIPFSDPVMDGPTIQEASAKALESGATPETVLSEVGGSDGSVPLIAMTYYNIVFRMGHRRFADRLVASGLGGAILPDLPLEESEPWTRAADAAGVATIMLAAPTGDDDRLARIAERATGFVYGVGLVGITGERAELAESAKAIAQRLKAITDKPVLIGVGISTPEQAAEVAEVADGVIVGSAIVRSLLESGEPDAAIDLVGRLRSTLDR